MQPNRLLSLLPIMAAGLAANANAEIFYWDAGTANIVTNGDGMSTYGSGTWSTGIANWDQGAGLVHVAWNNSNLDSAVFQGTASGNAVVDLQTDITVNQLKIASGNNNASYRIGTTDPLESSTLTFGGTYSDTFPAIDATDSPGVYARVTGTIAGGLVIKSYSNPNVAEGGRVYLANPGNDFVGDITVLSGNLHVASFLGDSGNSIILKGGALYGNTGSSVSYLVANNIEVSAASIIGFNATGGTSTMTLSGSISGAGNLNARSSGDGTKMLFLSGDMSGYTGTFDNLNGYVTIQTTATSGGAWKLSGGDLKLNADNNDAIANGAGRSDLVINGGTLNLNGRAETINGLSGASGFVQNALAGTTATLTMGDGDATASFGGTIRNHAPGVGGTLAITKIGAGTQSLLGNNDYTGPTIVADGTLVIGGGGTINSTSSLEIGAGGRLAYNSSNALTVAPVLSGIDASNRAVLGGTGTIQASLTLDNVGDTLSPGNSPGVQTYSMDQSWNSFSYDWEVNNFVGTTAGTDFDQIVINGTLDLTGGTKCYILNLLSLDAFNATGDVGGFADVNRSWTILATSGALTGFDATNWTLNTAGFTWGSTHSGTFSLGQAGDSLVLSYSVVPAGGVPDGGSTLAMLGTVLGSLALLRRKFTRARD